MLIDPQAVVDNSRNERLEFKLLVRPREVLFYRLDQKREPVEVLAALSFADENVEQDERLSRRFETADFEGLAAERPLLDPHIMDLLLVRALGRAPSSEALELNVGSGLAARAIRRRSAWPTVF